MSYYDGDNTDLKVVKCGNASCSAGNTVTAVDSIGDVGGMSSIAVGGDGFPVVSYYDNTNGVLKVAKCGNASCSSGNTTTTVDSSGNVGHSTSIKIGADGFPVVSYSDFTNNDLKVVKCGNASCSAGNTTTMVLDSPEGSDVNAPASTSLAIGGDGFPVVGYYNPPGGNLKVTKCGNASCSAGNTTTAVSTGDVGVGNSSIAVGGDGFPIMGYYYATGLDLRVIKCGNASCSSGNTTTTVDGE